MTMEEREAKRKESAKKSVVTHLISDPISGGRGRPKSDAEVKTHISVSILPSLHDDIKKITYMERTTVSALIGDLLETYKRNHMSEIEEYDNLNK